MQTQEMTRDSRWMTLFESVLKEGGDELAPLRAELGELPEPPPAMPRAARALRGVALWHVTHQLTGLTWFWEMRSELADEALDQDSREILGHDIRQQAEQFLTRGEAWDRLCKSLALEPDCWLFEFPCEDRLSYGNEDVLKCLLPASEACSAPARQAALLCLTRPPDEIDRIAEDYRQRLKREYEETC